MEICTESGFVVKKPSVHKTKDYVTTTFLMKKNYMNVCTAGVCGHGEKLFCVMLPGIDFVEIIDQIDKDDFVVVKGYITGISEVDQDRKTTVDDYILAEHVQIVGP